MKNYIVLVSGVGLSSLPFVVGGNVPTILNLICLVLGVYLCGLISRDIVDSWLRTRRSAPATATPSAAPAYKTGNPVRITVAANASEDDIARAVHARAKGINGQAKRSGDQKFIVVGETVFPVSIVYQEVESKETGFVPPVAETSAPTSTVFSY